MSESSHRDPPEEGVRDGGLSVEELESVIEALPGMVTVVDRDFNIRLANAAVIRQFGHARESEVLGKPCYQVRKGRRETCEECGIAQAYATGEPATRLSTPKEVADMGIVSKAYAIPLKDKNGAVWGGLEIIADITDAWHVEQALKLNKDRLRHFKFSVDSSSNAVGMSTPDGEHWYQNRAFDEMFGDVGTDPPATLYVDKALGREVFKTIMAGGHWTGELEMYGKNREVLPILLNANAIKDDGGEVIGLVGVHTDLSSRKRAESERLKLEHQLHKTQKLESLGVLAGGIAHDFNNLLGGIFGYIELASLSAQDPEVSLYLSKSLAAIDRARGLTRQLLTFSKGGVPTKKVQPLFPFVEETVAFALSGSRCSCKFEVPEDLWTCDFDAEQLRQVIDNVIINADQAMPLGGGVTVSARNVPDVEAEVLGLAAREHVKLSFRDTGVGMPSEILSNIFDPFFTTKQLGSGLGLTTCYSIVHRHNGHIEVSSTPGKGTTVDVYLPSSTESAAPVAKSGLRKPIKGGRILVMDDEMMIREYMTALLGSLGYEVVTEAHGEAAVRRFAVEMERHRPFLAVILDLTVPGGMGGRETLGAIRKLDAAVPVFVASGYADDPVMAVPESHGFTGSICKPFKREELDRLLSRFL